MLNTISYYDVLRRISVQTFTDAFVYDDDDNLFLVSITGLDSTVKAVSAALISKRRVSINSQGLWRLHLARNHDYKIFSVKLPCSALHQIVCSEELLGGKTMLYIPDNYEPHEILYNQVNSNFAVPMLPEWSNWLYQKLIADNVLSELSGRPKIIRFDLTEEYLDDIISNGVCNKEIVF